MCALWRFLAQRCVEGGWRLFPCRCICCYATLEQSPCAETVVLRLSNGRDKWDQVRWTWWGVHLCLKTDDFWVSAFCTRLDLRVYWQRQKHNLAHRCPEPRHTIQMNVVSYICGVSVQNTTRVQNRSHQFLLCWGVSTCVGMVIEERRVVGRVWAVIRRVVVVQMVIWEECLTPEFSEKKQKKKKIKKKKKKKIHRLSRPPHPQVFFCLPLWTSNITMVCLFIPSPTLSDCFM